MARRQKKLSPKENPKYLKALKKAKAQSSYIGSGPPVYFGQVATRCKIPTSNTTSQKQWMSRSRHIARENIFAIKIGLPNWYMKTTPNPNTETDTTGVATITASVEYPVGVFTQLKFSGVPTGTIPAGGTTYTDIANVWIPAGAEFFIRTWGDNQVSGIVYTGAQSPNPQQDNPNGERFRFGASVTDQTMGGTITTTDSINIYLPVAILGYTARPSFLIIGDSKAQGATNTGSDFSGTDTSSNVGEIERSIGPAFAYINVASASDRLQWQAAGFTKRLALAQFCSHCVIQSGFNDVNSDSRTPAQMATDLQTLSALLPIPMKKYVTTMESASTSTDRFITLVNQTTIANDANRTLVNIARRLIPAGFAGCFDVSTVNESSAGSGKWTVTGVRAVTDANITTGTAILTSATFAFTSADLGKTVSVVGAGAAAAVLYAPIITVTNGTTVTLGLNASTTVSGVVAELGIPAPDGVHGAFQANEAIRLSNVINTGIITR